MPRFNHSYINWRLCIFFLICYGLFIVSNKPFFDRVISAPTDTIVPWVHLGEIDYYTYIAFIHESKEGAWQVPALYTTEPTKPSFIYTYYIGVGKFARLFNLSPVAAYHVARIFIFGLFVFSLFFVGRKIAGRSLWIWAILMGLFSSAPATIFGWKMYSGGFDLWMATIWWHNLDPLYRIDYVPHHMFGITMMFLTIVCVMRLIKTETKWPWLAIISAFLAGITYPAPSLVIVCGLPIALLITFLKTHKKTVLVFALRLVPIIIASTVAVLLIQHETYKGFPWSQWRVWDIQAWNKFPHFNRDFFVGHGVLFLTALPAMIWILYKSNDFIRIFTAIWALLPFVLLYVADPLQIAKIRLGFLGQFVPLGILSIWTIEWFTLRIRSNMMRWATIVFLVFFFLAFNLPNTAAYYKLKKDLTNLPSSTMRIPTTTLAAALYISQNSQPYDIILAPEPVSLVLPAFARVRVYGGHIVHTQQYHDKSVQINAFFTNTMQKQEARELIQKNHINYVIEVRPANISNYQLPVAKLYANNQSTIYKVLEE